MTEAMGSQDNSIYHKKYGKEMTAAWIGSDEILKNVSYKWKQNQNNYNVKITFTSIAGSTYAYSFALFFKQPFFRVF